MKIILCSIRNIFIIYIFFIQVKYILLYEFFIHYFSGEHIWSSTCIYKGQNFTFSMQVEQHYEGAKKLRRGKLEYCMVKTK